jgi:shikimate kinase
MSVPVRPIFLLGMMGAGKTRVGRALAASRGAVFVDLDARVELLFAATIPELFERGGEPYFRACERAALRSLLHEPGFAGASVVVATGGGVVVDPANLDDMAAVGVLVYLELSPERLAERLATPEQIERRPMLGAEAAEVGEPGARAAARSRIDALLRAREPAYRRAGVTVDADAEVDEVASRVARALDQLALMHA